MGSFLIRSAFGRCFGGQAVSRLRRTAVRNDFFKEIACGDSSGVRIGSSAAVVGIPQSAGYAGLPFGMTFLKKSPAAILVLV